MSTHRPTAREQLAQCNDSIAKRYGMTVRVYKVVKAVTQLVGAAAGIYAMALGADPMVAFALIATIVSGPEALELLIANTEAPPDGGGGGE